MLRTEGLSDVLVITGDDSQLSSNKCAFGSRNFCFPSIYSLHFYRHFPRGNYFAKKKKFSFDCIGTKFSRFVVIFMKNIFNILHWRRLGVRHDSMRDFELVFVRISQIRRNLRIDLLLPCKDMTESKKNFFHR